MDSWLGGAETAARLEAWVARGGAWLSIGGVCGLEALLGASLLWLGWFGFNAGSALTAGDLAGVAFTNTMLATCTAVLGWLVVEQDVLPDPTNPNQPALDQRRNREYLLAHGL